MSSRILLLATLFVVGCQSDVERAYETCVQRAVEATGDEVGKNLSEEAAAIAREGQRAVAEQGCKIVRTRCESDPDGELCKSMLERYE